MKLFVYILIIIFPLLGWCQKDTNILNVKRGNISVKKVVKDSIGFTIDSVSPIQSSVPLTTISRSGMAVNHIIDPTFTINSKKNSKNIIKSKRWRRGYKKVGLDKKKGSERWGSVEVFSSKETNRYGVQAASDSGNYVGFVGYSYNQTYPRTYLRTGRVYSFLNRISSKRRRYSAFSNSLEKGKTYCLSFYVSLSDESKYACNKIGVILPTKKKKKAQKKNWRKKEKDFIIEDDSKGFIKVKLNNEEVIDDKKGWTLIKGEFVATGKEIGVYIGNFEQNKALKVKAYDDSNLSIPLAFYYLSKVSLVEKSVDCLCSE